MTDALSDIPQLPVLHDLDVEISFSSAKQIVQSLTLIEPAYDIFVLGFRPKKQQFLVALPTP